MDVAIFGHFTLVVTATAAATMKAVSQAAPTRYSPCHAENLILTKTLPLRISCGKKIFT